MNNDNKCLFCKYDVKKADDFPTVDQVTCECPNCGKYILSFAAQSFDLPTLRKLEEKLYIISGYIRELQETGQKPPFIHEDNDIQELFNSANPPKTLKDKLDKLLMYLYRKTLYINMAIKITNEQPALVYAKNADEFSGLIISLSKLKMIKVSKSDATIKNELNAKKESGEIIINNDEMVSIEFPSLHEYPVTLTIKGFKIVEKLNTEINNASCFVAMSFDKDLKYIYNDAIEPAVKETMYIPTRIDAVEHIDGIVDKIVAEIRRSKFVIVELSQHKNGVYYEAGFAAGLNRPVIFTCEENEFEKIHFDIKHINIIKWKNAKELKERLIDRINALFPFEK